MKNEIELVDKLEGISCDAMDNICVMAKKALKDGRDHQQALKNIAECASFYRDDIFYGFKKFYR